MNCVCNDGMARLMGLIGGRTENGYRHTACNCSDLETSRATQQREQYPSSPLTMLRGLERWTLQSVAPHRPTGQATILFTGAIIQLGSHDRLSNLLGGRVQVPTLHRSQW